MLSDKWTQGAACARPLRAADTLPVAVTVQRITPQAAPLLFLPHPRRSCDFHMVSLTSLISYKLCVVHSLSFQLMLCCASQKLHFR